MSSMHFALYGTLIAALLMQCLLVFGFVARLKRWKRPLLADPDCPQAIVVLCLRGGDPFLSRCLEGLFEQDYPNYQIRFMVDHADDPAMSILRNALEGRHRNARGDQDTEVERYRIAILQDPLMTCSLKCSCLVQAIDSFPSSVEVVALLDADTIPHATWLRELVTALAPADIGAATGNRWYMPNRADRGSLVRYVWNAAAIVQMYWYEIAWGGTLAIKLDSLRRAGILERWRLAYGEDTMIRKALSGIGQKVTLVPSLMMINREDCTLVSFQGWVKRQLLSARLYHPFWSLVLAHGIGSAVLILWAMGSCVVSAIQGDWVGVGAVLLSLSAYHIGLTCMLPWMESAICEIAEGRGEASAWPSRPNGFKLLWIAWLTQGYYTWALVNCLFMNRFVWRGIEYHVAGPWRIRMMGYQPYTSDRTLTDTTSI